MSSRHAPCLNSRATFTSRIAARDLRIGAEVFGGCWDALASGRADIVIGAPGDGPAGGGYTVRSLGDVEWVFAVAPGHALASVPEPLRADDIQLHRAASAADSSRNLPPRTSGAADRSGNTDRA